MYFITENYKRSKISVLAESLAEFLFPSNTYCLCCGKIIDQSSLYSICEHCRDRIQWGNIVVDTAGIRTASGVSPHIDSISAAAHYGLYTRPIVEQFKNEGRTYIARQMAEIMWERMASDGNASHLMNADLVIPVPTAKGEEERGFNHSRKLAGYIALNMGAEMLDCLYKRPESGLQKAAGSIERFVNLEGAIGIRDWEQGDSERCLTKRFDRRLFGKKVLLIDDVCTTGATLNECAGVLKNAGASEVHGLVFATANRHASGFFDESRNIAASSGMVCSS